MIIVSCHSTLLKKNLLNWLQLNNTLFAINFTIYNEKQDLKNQTLECCGKVCRGWFSHVSETSSLVDGCLGDDVRAAVLNKNKKQYHKLFTLTSVCIFSILFFTHLPRCWKENLSINQEILWLVIISFIFLIFLYIYSYS